MTHHKQTQAGFALLITILMVSVVVAVTLSIIELSLKQLQLSVDARDAEIAFQAASAGLECAQRLRREQSDTMLAGGSIQVDCFSPRPTTFTSSNATGIATAGTDGSLRRYQEEIDWAVDTSPRCSTIDIWVLQSGENDTFTVGNTGAGSLQRIIANYTSPTKECSIGGVCTLITVTGYNSTCSNKNSRGTLKREMLLEF